MKPPPNVIQDAPELRREDRSGLSHTFSPDAKPNPGEAFNSPFKTADSSLLRTPPRLPLQGDNHFLTPIQRKQRSAERDPRNRHSDVTQSSPVLDGRLKNNNRSLTLADFIKESPNQKKRQGIFTPKSEKVATSTPSQDSENHKECNEGSPAWKNKKPQRRIKPTKILSFEDEKSSKSGELRISMIVKVEEHLCPKHGRQNVLPHCKLKMSFIITEWED